MGAAEQQHMGHVFLSYVREDSTSVDWLESRLTAAGIPVWRDVRDLWPGHLWRRQLREAIEAGSLAFVPCFSTTVSRKPRSVMFEELTWAGEEFRRRQPGTPWIFPVLLDECDPPHIDLGMGATLHDVQWTRLGQDRDEQVERLIVVLRKLLPRSVWGYTAEALLSPYNGEGRRLAGEFIGAGSDLVIWDKFHDDSRLPVVLRCADGYRQEYPIQGVGPCDRVRRARGTLLTFAAKKFAAKPDRLTIVDVEANTPLNSLLIPDPRVSGQSEVVHPTEPLLAVSTDHGTIVCWDWQKDRIRFSEEYFEGNIWIKDLATDGEEDIVWFTLGNILFGVAWTNGELKYEIQLGDSEETYAIAFHGESNLVAIGGVMATYLYRRSGSTCELLQRFENRSPLTLQIAINRDATTLAIATGGLGAGGVAIVDLPTSQAIMNVNDEYGRDGLKSTGLLGSSLDSVVFSETGDLLAIGQGSRLGLYRRVPIDL